MTKLLPKALWGYIQNGVGHYILLMGMTVLLLASIFGLIYLHISLTLTENAQPALMAVSVAVARVLKVEFGIDVSKAGYVAGHSLGEYSALAAAGAISLSVGERRVDQEPTGNGAMRHGVVGDQVIE